MERPAYPSDLSDREWQLWEPLLPPPKAITYPRREIVNAIRYVLRTGCSWRMLPHDLPPWRIVFHYFRTWRRDGTWQRAHDTLHATAAGSGPGGQPQRGHHRQPVGKDHGKRGPRGYDAGKKVKGRKRHIVVDTLCCGGGGASG